jgi:protochlorophyllide reductase
MQTHDVAPFHITAISCSDLLLLQLCNVLFTRELQKRLKQNDATSGIIANCYNPGLIVGTGLFRNQNKLFTKVFDFAATDLLKVGETPTWGGGCLAYMATAVTTQGQYYSSAPGTSKYGDSAYGKQFSVTPVSQEAQDEAKAIKLWQLTERELGLSA